MGRSPSVRTQLLVLELGIAVPLLGLIGLLLSEFQSAEEKNARASIARLAQLAATEIQAYVHDVDASLDRLAERRDMRAADPARCDPVFDDYTAQHLRTTNLALFGPGNRRWCAADAREGGAPLPAQLGACLDAVWRTQAAATSPLFRDVRDGRWTLVRARPVIREGRCVAVLATWLDLGRLRAALWRGVPQAPAALAVVDQGGAAIWGSRLRNQAGRRSFTAEVRLPELGWMVRACIPETLALREHHERVIELVTLCIILLTLATALALFVSSEIARPIQALSAAARKAAAGRLEARAPVEGSAETAEVARSFNAMLAARADVEQALRESALRLRLAIQVANVGLWELDLRTREAFYSPEWKAQLGYANGDLEDRPFQWRPWLHPTDRRRVIASEDAFMAEPRGHFHAQFRLRHRTGRFRWFLSRMDVLRDPHGEPVRLVGWRNSCGARSRCRPWARWWQAWRTRCAIRSSRSPPPWMRSRRGPGSKVPTRLT